MFGVIEGADGVGKSTQHKLLADRIRRELHVKVVTFDFPQYETTLGGKLVGQFLSGEFGGINDIHPKLASLPYAMDRWQAKSKIKNVIDKGEIVLANRYVLSSKAHQTAKLPAKKREEFLKFIDELEYKVFGIPKEDFNIFLYVPALKAQKLVDKKSERNYLKGKKRDIHEADGNHLSAATQMYIDLAKRFPKKIFMINCSNSKGKLMTPVEIHELVWEKVSNIIKKRK